MNQVKPSIWCPGINNGHPLTRGLVLAMPFWEGGGDTVMDVSGNGNVGMVVGPTWNPTSCGPGLTFVRDTHRVQI